MVVNKNRGNWKSVLKADPTGWLLESNNPPVRYFTLKDILERAENDPEVRDARKSIMTAGIVPRILEQQNEDGSWGVPDDFYLGAKYKGTVWNIIVLAELGAEGRERHAHQKSCGVYSGEFPGQTKRRFCFSIRGRRRRPRKGYPLSHRQHGF